jgi:hypothetical protein
MLDCMDSREITGWQQFFVVRDEKDKEHRRLSEWERKHNFGD